MSEWVVVTVIIALVGLVTAIVTPILKLNTTITKLNSSVDSLGKSVSADINNINKELGTLQSRNSDSHKRIFENLEDQCEKLNNHETRITLIEKKDVS